MINCIKKIIIVKDKFVSQNHIQTQPKEITDSSMQVLIWTVMMIDDIQVDNKISKQNYNSRYKY